MTRFEGRIVLLTGAGSGIAAAASRRFHDEGATVIALDRTDLADHPLHGSARFRAVVQDLADPVPDDLFTRFGPVDVLVNAAGILHRSSVLEHTLADWRRTMAVNVEAPFELAARFARTRIEQGGGGVILNVCSIESYVALPEHAAYTASKSALLMMTKSFAAELAPFAVRVNAIAPGVTATGMNKTLRDDAGASAELASRIPLGRFGDPADQAAALTFLASEEASYITGAVLAVDGGWLTV